MINAIQPLYLIYVENIDDKHLLVDEVYPGCKNQDKNESISKNKKYKLLSLFLSF